MKTKNPFAATEKLLSETAKLAKKKGIQNLVFTWQDVSDLYRVYGVNATPAKFLAMLKWRNAK